MVSEKVKMYLTERKKAEIRGDWGVWRSITSDLARIGYQDPKPLAEVDDPVLVAEPKRRGPQKRPRCEHGQIADRCPDCDPEQLVA